MPLYALFANVEHSSQTVELRFGRSPGRQLRHAPAVPAVPRGHATHDCCNVSGSVPSSHTAQRPLTPADIAGHGPHCDCPLIGVQPSSHREQVPPDPANPTGHAAHPVRLLIGSLPFGQVMQAEPAGLADVSLTRSHSTQLVAALGAFGCSPGAHSLHSAPESLKYPSLHSSHEITYWSGILPRGHAEHNPWVPAVPDGQGWHLNPSAVGVYPSTHERH